MLQMLRGTDEVDAEYADICDAAVTASKVSPWQVSVRQRRACVPHLLSAARSAGRQVCILHRVWWQALACFRASNALLQSWKNLVARHNLPMTVMACSLAALQRESGCLPLPPG